MHLPMTFHLQWQHYLLHFYNVLSLTSPAFTSEVTTHIHTMSCVCVYGVRCLVIIGQFIHGLLVAIDNVNLSEAPLVHIAHSLSLLPPSPLLKPPSFLIIRYETRSYTLAPCCVCVCVCVCVYI